MSRLVVGNWSNEAGLHTMSPEQRRHIGAQGQRMLWHARPGDVVLLPMAPPAGFVAYVTDELDLEPRCLEVVVPPEGKLSSVLTADRLEDEAFTDELRALVRDRGVDRVVPFFLDDTVRDLARRLGLAERTTGYAFMDQGGAELLNSKAAFRAVAAGLGLPVPSGLVTGTPAAAVDFAARLLGAGTPVMVKQDVNVGGYGNEILSPRPGLEPAGALTVRVAGSRAAVEEQLAERWSWYSDGGRRRVVLEEYLPGTESIWGEVSVSDEGVEILGTGTVRLKPVIDGVVIPVPPPTATIAAFPGFLADVRRLAEAMRAIGYRGLTNIDAMVTGDGRVLFNEFNARFGGSTHLFAIGTRVVGGDYLADRTVVERRDCPFPGFDPALRCLVDHKLAYNRHTRTGVLVPVCGTDLDGTSGEACIVAETPAAAEAMERTLVGLFTRG